MVNKVVMFGLNNGVDVELLLNDERTIVRLLFNCYNTLIEQIDRTTQKFSKTIRFY